MADDYNFSGLQPPEVAPASGPNPSSIPPVQDSSDALPVIPKGTLQDGYDLSGLKVTDPETFIKSAAEEKYGGVGQTVLAGLEGAGQGVLGPIAPALERASGLTTADDIRGRKLAHPVIHGLSEAGAFGASAAFGDELGLSGVVGEAGNIAEHLIPGVAGVRSAAELAAISASNEFSKMVEQDPNQTLGSAAINVGLATAMGGIGGNLLDRFNPLKYFAKSAMRSKATGAINDILSGVGGGLAGAGVGGALGAAVGLPKVGSIVGGVIGEKALSPIFSALLRPLSEKIANTAAAEAAYDYLYSSNAGQRALNNYIGSFFERGAQAVNLSELKGIVMPSQASRDDLKHILEKADNIDNAINVGGNIAHYLPDHTTGASETLSNAINYFKSIKPNPQVGAPLDQPPPVHKGQENNYNRQLDIAQQPLVALQHVKEGTLIPQDLITLRTIWPGLHDSMIQKITNSMIDNKAKVQQIPYAQRVSLNQFIGGAPLDSTMTPSSMQSIMMSSSPKSQQMAIQHKNGGPRNASSATLNQINKTNQLYATPLQSRSIAKRQ